MDNPKHPVLPKKKGRPSKDRLAEVKKRPVGRPKGDASAIEEFKARLMASPKSRKVLDSILDAALDDDHKNQAAAWKLLVDRMLPMSYFDKATSSNSRPSVNITISGVGETIVSDVIDAEDIS
jgi:hypothetical protein